MITGAVNKMIAKGEKPIAGIPAKPKPMMDKFKMTEGMAKKKAQPGRKAKPRPPVDNSSWDKPKPKGKKK